MRALRARPLAAFAWSIAVHAALLYVVGVASWVPSERVDPEPQVAVVWLDPMPPLASIPAAPGEVSLEALPAQREPAARIESVPEPVPEPTGLDDQSELPRDGPQPAPQTDAVETADESAPLEAPGDAIDGPAETDGAAPSRNYIVRDVDWDEELTRAIEQTREQRLREDSYLTFSLDDVVEPAPPEEPGPTESIFDAAARQSRGGPSLLSPGQTRTAFGQRLARLCNSLTGGGIGLMGFASLCADPDESAGLFAHLQPSYLKARPVCTEVTTPGGVVADEEIKAVKCRLVVADE